MVSAKKSRSSSMSRETLLNAANQVVVAQGVEALTLEAVARTAGVSKGGLLHYFPNKNALITGMLNQLIDEFTNTLERELAQNDALNRPGRWTRAYVRASLQFDRQAMALYSNLLVPIATNPELLKPIQDCFSQWQAQLEQDGLESEMATLIRLAVDGIVFARLFGAAPPSEEMENKIFDALLKLTQQS